MPQGLWFTALIVLTLSACGSGETVQSRALALGRRACVEWRAFNTAYTAHKAGDNRAARLAVALLPGVYADSKKAATLDSANSDRRLTDYVQVEQDVFVVLAATPTPLDATSDWVGAVNDACAVLRPGR